jgi:hypothetical protein
LNKGVFMEMWIRRQSRRERWLGWLDGLPLWQKAAMVAVPLGVAVIVVAGRRRMWQGVGVVASAVEEVADTIEDAAEDVRDTARERAAT